MVRSDCGAAVPPVSWDDCVSPTLFDGAILLSGEPPGFRVRLVGGAPLVLQVQLFGDRLLGKQLDDFALARQGKLPPRDGPLPAYYVYFLIEPLKRDDSGRVIELRLRPVECGRLPDGFEGKGTTRPLKGLAMDNEGLNCLAADRPALDRAVRATTTMPRRKLPGSPPLDVYRWVAELTPEDQARIRQSTIAE